MGIWASRWGLIGKAGGLQSRGCGFRLQIPGIYQILDSYYIKKRKYFNVDKWGT